MTQRRAGLRVGVIAVVVLSAVAVLVAQQGPPFEITPASAVSGGGTVTSPQLLAPDGTALLPAYSFASEPTLGFWRSAAQTVTVQGTLNATAALNAATSMQAPVFFGPATGTRMNLNVADGTMTLATLANTIGSRLKADALPTVASGFGGSPAVIAGSTPLAGAVDVGTGGAATTGVITFGGTAFPSTPFCIAQGTLTNQAIRTTPTTTQLTINCGTAWIANDIVKWICISAK